MRELTVYNTLTRKKELFKPVTPGQVKMYVCGITPYNHSHMGNARPFVTWDVIKRYLKHLGYQVKTRRGIPLPTAILRRTLK